MLEELFRHTIYTQNYFQLMAHMAHWNVTGMFFYQYHLLFERVYNTIVGDQDGLVELARGYDVIITAREFDPTGIEEKQDPQELVIDLLAYNQVYKVSLERLREEAENEEKYGIVNFVEGVLSNVDTISYLLKSSVSISSTASVSRNFHMTR